MTGDDRRVTGEDRRVTGEDRRVTGEDRRLTVASSAWRSLVAARVKRSRLRRRTRLTESGRRGAAPLWPLSQVLHAGLLLDRATGEAPGLDDVVGSLDDYWSGHAFAAVPGGSERFYDDNGWIALADETARRVRGTPLLNGVQRDTLDDWLLAAQDDDGGLPWREGLAGRHAVTTGTAGVALALRCERQPQRVVSAAVVAASSFLHDVLRDGDDLLRDRIDAEGSIEPTVWSYNQGGAVALESARHRLGTAGALARARRYAAAGIARFAGAAGWEQPVSFHAVWCRGLVALAATAGDHTWLDPVSEYADALVALPGLGAGSLAGSASVPGPGRYEPGRSDALDVAGAIQVLTLPTLATLPTHATTGVVC